MSSPVSNNNSSSNVNLYPNLNNIASTTQLNPAISTLAASEAGGTTVSLNQVNLPSPTISFLEYLSTVSTSIQQAKQQALESQIATDLGTQGQYGTLAQSALNNVNLLQILQQALLNAANSATGAQNTINSQLASANSAINTYNNGTGAQVSFTGPNNTTITVTDGGLSTDVSQWLNLYNKVTEDEAVINNPNSTQAQIAAAQLDMQIAVDTYNAYVSLRNPDINAYNAYAAPGVQGTNENLNGAIDQYNTSVQQLNSVGANAGIPAIPTINNLNQATNLPYYNSGLVPPQPSHQPIANITAPNIATSTALYNSYYSGIAQQVSQALKNASNQLQAHVNFTDYLKYNINNTSKVASSAAFIQETSPSANQSGGQGSAPGQGTNLDNSNIISAVGKALTAQAQLPVTNPSTQVIKTDPANQLGVAFLQALGLTAVIPSLALLGDVYRTLSPGDKTLDSALQTQSLLHTVGALNTTDVLNQLEEALRLLFPTLSGSQISAISAGLQLALTTTASNLQANSINQPGLTAQIVALVAGTQPSQPSQNSANTIADVLQNQQFLQSLAQSVAASQTIAFATVTQAITAAVSQLSDQQQQVIALANKNADLAQQQVISSFQNTVSQSLQEQGVLQQQAAAASEQAGQLLQSQIQAGNLQNQSLQSSNLQQEILNQSLASSLLQTQAANSSSQALTLAKQVTSTIFGSSHNLTDTQIRTSIQKQLPNIVPNISAQQAAIVSNSVHIVSGTTPDLSSLQIQQATNTNPQGLTRANVALSSTEATINQLTPTVGYAKASELASTITRAQVGAAEAHANDNSVLQLVTDQTHFINSLQNKADAQTAAQTFSDFISPNSNLADLSEKIRSPSTSMLHQGIMYAHQDFTAGSGQGRDVPPVSIPV